MVYVSISNYSAVEKLQIWEIKKTVFSQLWLKWLYLIWELNSSIINRELFKVNDVAKIRKKDWIDFTSIFRSDTKTEKLAGWNLCVQTQTIQSEETVIMERAPFRVHDVARIIDKIRELVLQALSHSEVSRFLCIIWILCNGLLLNSYMYVWSRNTPMVYVIFRYTGWRRKNATNLIVKFKISSIKRNDFYFIMWEI